MAIGPPLRVIRRIVLKIKGQKRTFDLERVGLSGLLTVEVTSHRGHKQVEFEILDKPTGGGVLSQQAEASASGGSVV